MQKEELEVFAKRYKSITGLDAARATVYNLNVYGNEMLGICKGKVFSLYDFRPEFDVANRRILFNRKPLSDLSLLETVQCANKAKEVFECLQRQAMEYLDAVEKELEKSK